MTGHDARGTRSSRPAAALFHSPDGKAYASTELFADVPGDDRAALETWALRSKDFKAYLARMFYEHHEQGPRCPGPPRCHGVLESKALYDGVELDVSVRVANHHGTCYLDLADEDRTVLEIDARGWRVCPRPPVRFRHPKAMLPLPMPERPGRLDLLGDLVNARGDDLVLLTGWVVATLAPSGPYPVLALHGEQGTAKSTGARIVRGIFDPNEAPLRAEPRDGHSLMIAAANGHVVALDNLSSIRPWLSDALCRLSTGGGFSARTLYSDDEETIFDSQRPVVITGISDVIERADLLDRTIVLNLERIDEADREPESELWSRFEAARPQILAGLLDAVACSLRDLPTVRLDAMPRMADFAMWVVAAESSMPWEEGGFMKAYSRNRGLAHELSLEASVIAGPIRDLEAFEGTATELYELLTEKADEKVVHRKTWPSGARALSAELKRLAPNLREVGIEVDFARSGKRRVIRIAPESSVTNVISVTDQPLGDARDANDANPAASSSELT